MSLADGRTPPPRPPHGGYPSYDVLSSEPPDDETNPAVRRLFEVIREALALQQDWPQDVSLNTRARAVYDCLVNARWTPLLDDDFPFKPEDLEP